MPFAHAPTIYTAHIIPEQAQLNFRVTHLREVYKNRSRPRTADINNKRCRTVVPNHFSRRSGCDITENWAYFAGKNSLATFPRFPRSTTRIDFSTHRTHANARVHTRLHAYTHMHLYTHTECTPYVRKTQSAARRAVANIGSAFECRSSNVPV